MDLDYIMPFAGIPENGREIDGLDDHSELFLGRWHTDIFMILGF